MRYHPSPVALEDTIESHPDALALVTDDATWTYRELGRAVRGVADRRYVDLATGVRVGVAVAPPSVGAILDLWAAWTSGMSVMVLGASLARDSADHIRRPAVSDEMCLVPTSGSTAESKVVILTRSNVSAAVSSSQERLGNDTGETWLLCLPLNHVAGLSILWRSVAAGGAVRLMPRFSAAVVAGLLREGRIQWVSLVPTMLKRVLDADSGPYPPTVRGVLVGGAAADDHLIRRGLDAGLPVLATYGLTETCSQVATVAPGDALEALGTVGRPMSSMTVRIVDGSDVPVEQGECGEITVEGPAVSQGYDGEPPRVRYLSTGDIGRLDDRGRLEIMGRLDDVINTGGENVHPSLVESVIESHDAVSAAAVFGVRDTEWGHVVVAVVAADRVTVDELATLARNRLAPYEVPKHWRLVVELPLLPGGKVDRAAVRGRYDDGFGAGA